MATGSRLRPRRITHTVDIVKQTLASGQYADSNLYNNLPATKDNTTSVEVAGGGGIITVRAHVFWFEATNGVLPAIKSKHVIVDGSDRYEIIEVIERPYMNRLKAVTRKIN